MKLVCPACGAEIGLDQAGRAADLLALEKASQAFGGDWELVQEYLNCFRRRLQGTLQVSKRLRLAREVYEIWQGGQFQVDKEHYRVSREGLREGLRQMANREITGLTNHNYLKKILREAARAESRDKERQLRDREARLQGGGRVELPAVSSQQPAALAAELDRLATEGIVPPGKRKFKR